MRTPIQRAAGDPAPDLRAYAAYGLTLRSPLSLAGAREGPAGGPEVELLPETGEELAAARAAGGIPEEAADWFEHRRLADGRDYLRWSGLFEFLVAPDGGRVRFRACDGGGHPEVLETYLLGQVLSFALTRRGIEPLHATVVSVDGTGLALVGECGRGKSTLGAAFLAAGHRLLTDDLLVVTPRPGGYLAHPGLARIKLFPEVAEALLGPAASGPPMNPDTPKRVIPLGAAKLEPSPVPLAAICLLGDPSEAIELRRVAPREALLELIGNCFNCVVVEPARLERQFRFLSRLVREVPVAELTYPRDLAALPGVRRALRDRLLEAAG